MNNEDIKPTVSVIIPTYNRADLLPRAIKSVLNQTFQDFEIIVVDDASKDNTEDVVKGLQDARIRYIRHETNRGGSAARNTGIKEAKGMYIAFLDDDDEWYPIKLERQVEFFETLPNKVGAIYCGYVHQEGGNEQIIFRNEKGALIMEILCDEFAPGASSTLIFRKDVLREIGFFDETFQRHQDLEILIRLFKNYTIDVVPEPLLKINGHTYQEALKVERIKLHFLRVFKNEIAMLSFAEARKVYAIQYMFLAKLFLHERKITSFARYVFSSLYFYPFLFRDYLSIVKSAILVPIKWCGRR